MELAHFAEAGCLLVETSHSYAGGQAEAAVGRWLRKNPGTLGVATKVGHDTSGRDIPLSRENVHDHVRSALENLGVDTVDVLLHHCDDPARSVAELADTLIGLVEDGRVRRVGVSNWRADRLAVLAQELAGRGHLPGQLPVQPRRTRSRTAGRQPARGRRGTRRRPRPPSAAAELVVAGPRLLRPHRRTAAGRRPPGPVRHRDQPRPARPLPRTRRPARHPPRDRRPGLDPAPPGRLAVHRPAHDGTDRQLAAVPAPVTDR